MLDDLRTSRNSLRLPKTLSSSSVQELIAGFDSEDIDTAVPSYTALSSLANSHTQMINSDLIIHSQPNAPKFYEQLASSPGRALATVCSIAKNRFVKDADAVVSACRSLAELIQR